MTTKSTGGGARRQRGRPQLTSREEIVAAALALLDSVGLERFTLAKLAERLGVSVMALYFYFPSRDALLDAVTDELFSRFQPPDEDLPWRAAVRLWIERLYDLLDGYPLTLTLVRRGEHFSPTYVHVWLPVARALRRAGLSGADLAIAVNWLIKMAVGLCNTHMRKSRADDLKHMMAQSQLSPADHELLAEIQRHSDSSQGGRMLDMGVEAIVARLEDLIEGRKPL